jgi:hypothetical protein
MPPNITVDVHCPLCNKGIMFVVDGGNFRNSKEFPIRFPYKHGNPLHNAIVSLNQDFQIIDVSFTPLASGKRPKKATLDEFLLNFSAKGSNEVGDAIKRLVNDLPQVYQNRPQDADDKYFEFGFELATKVGNIFSGATEVQLVEDVAKLYETSKLGKIIGVQTEGNITNFHITELYENPKKLDAGNCLYRISEGFLRNLLQRKFNKSYLTKSSYDKVHRACELQMVCQWSDFAEKLKKRLSKKA